MKKSQSFSVFSGLICKQASKQASNTNFLLILLLIFSFSGILMAQDENNPEPYTAPEGYYVVPSAGDNVHQALGYVSSCSPCENSPWNTNPYYEYLEDNNTVPPVYYYLSTRIPFYQEINGIPTRVGTIEAYYKFKRHKLCDPNIAYNYEALVIDVWKICFSVDDSTTRGVYESLPLSDLIALAPSATEMIRLVHKELGTHLKYYFNYFSRVGDPSVSGTTADWWVNNFWGRAELKNAIVFLNPCSMQPNYLTWDGGITYCDICYEKCSDNCCKTIYLFDNKFKKYDDNGVPSKCTNHWLCTNRYLISGECVNYNMQNCEQICNDGLFYFEEQTEYIKDETYKTNGCTECANYIPQPKINLLDDINLSLNDIGKVRIFNYMGSLINELNEAQFSAYNLNENLTSGIYILQYFDKNMRIISNKKIIVK